MTTGAGVALIGGWFGTGPDRGLALVFIITAVIGLAAALFALGSKYYRQLTERYQNVAPTAAVALDQPIKDGLVQ
jgi:DHA3 family multidrug efflux protein-like MFS transporter